jgi:hypothetical protein
VIYIPTIREMRRNQWDKYQIRVSVRVRVHGKKGLKMLGTTVIKEKRGIQWDKFQIRVLGRGQVHAKKILENDRYHYDHEKERNPMG